MFLAEVELGEDSVRSAVVDFMPYSFAAVGVAGKKCFDTERRHVYTTPKTFLELIKLFSNMLEARRTKLTAAREMYETGLVKLEETEQVVGGLEEVLKVTTVEVEAKKVEADKVATIVGIEKAKVQIQSDIASDEAEKCNIIKRDATELQDTCESEVAKLIPLVEQAKEK
jgi:dynein heavy chain